MKVAFIRYRYNPFGGAELFTQVLAERLAERGMEIHLFARSWSGPNNSLVRLHRIGGPGWPAILGHAGFVFLVGRAIGKESFDLVQSNERTLCQDIYRAGDGVHASWLELRGVRQTWLRRMTIRCNPFHIYRLRLERRLFESPRLKAVVVNSNMVRDEILSRFRISRENLHTIYNGVDLQRFHPSLRMTAGLTLRRQHGVADDEPLVLFVGSGFERKGLADLLRGVAMAGEPAWVWVVGKDKAQGKYEALARKLGIQQQVVFWGPQQDVARFYGAADIFVLPTLYDPFPNVILEAMASGLPVITTPHCGAAEIITSGREGFVLDPTNDPISNTENMADCLKHLYRRSVREPMGAMARRRAESFPVERAIDELEALFTRLLDGTPRVEL